MERQSAVTQLIRNVGLPQYRQAFGFLQGMIFWLGTVLVLGGIGIGDASMLTQTTFENGERAPWETFVTPNGTVGEVGWPTLVLFETAEVGQGSMALQFKVGQVRYDPENELNQGGGMVAQITTETGKLELSAHVAVTYQSPKDKRNLAGGVFEWIVDDHVVVRYDMGPIDNHRILRHHLKVSHQVNAGVHSIRLRITRPFTSHPGQHAPFQYIDNLFIRLSPNP